MAGTEVASVAEDVTNLIGAGDKPSDNSPLIKFLVALGIKGTAADNENSDGATSVIKGSPQSVAVIEATATAACKWWSAGLGVAVAGVWAGIAGWWAGQADHPATQRVGLWMAAIVTAAAVIGIAYLLGSDVRGRAAASVATIQARAQVGDKLLDASQALLALSPASSPCPPPHSSASATSPPAPTTTHPALPPAPQAELVALTPIDIGYIPRPSEDESGWKAIALFSNGDDVTKYLVVKGAVHSWANASDIRLPATAAPAPPAPPIAPTAPETRDKAVAGPPEPAEDVPAGGPPQK